MDDQDNISKGKAEQKADNPKDRRTITSRANMAKARAAKIEQMKKAREAELGLARLKKEKEPKDNPKDKKEPDVPIGTTKGPASDSSDDQPESDSSLKESFDSSDSDSSDDEPVLVIRQRPVKVKKVSKAYKREKHSLSSGFPRDSYDIEYEQIADWILPEIVERVKLAKKARSLKKASIPKKQIKTKDNKKQLSSGKVEDRMMAEFLRTIHKG